jgi:hypothetical protein
MVAVSKQTPLCVASLTAYKPFVSPLRFTEDTMGKKAAPFTLKV